MSKNIEKENNLKPQDFISKNIGQIVDVKLQNEEVYQGLLVSLDGAMNMYMQNVSQLDSPSSENFEHLFIRGNNVLYITEGSSKNH